MKTELRDRLVALQVVQPNNWLKFKIYSGGKCAKGALKQAFSVLKQFKK